jgi:hypothetical protein
MIICSICQTQNDQFATICTKCGGYLQNRVYNLDLFDTVWKIIEDPKTAFRLIMTAEHKNYVIFLYTLIGITVAFAGEWCFELGGRFENILLLIFWTLVVGLPLGVVLCPIVSFFHFVLSIIFKGKASFGASAGITSYASAPIILSLIFILPIELMTFGIYFFTFNPNPMAIKPVSYILLIGFDSAMILWSFLLTVIGTNVGNHIPIWRSFFVVAILYSLVITGLIAGSKYALHLF